jgi:hypothetical protein
MGKHLMEFSGVETPCLTTLEWSGGVARNRIPQKHSQRACLARQGDKLANQYFVLFVVNSSIDKNR